MKWIGIDTGTHTGLAVWDDKKREIIALETLPIHKAMSRVLAISGSEDVFVIFEDARQRTWFGKDRNTNAKLQGAGSIKRDCRIWADFLKDYEIPFRAVPPIKGGTKLSEAYFKLITHYQGRTSNHSRDAAMLVFGK